MRRRSAGENPFEYAIASGSSHHLPQASAFSTCTCGGEPLEFPGLAEVLDRLRGVVFRSVTTNGLMRTGIGPRRYAGSIRDRTASLHRGHRAIASVSGSSLRQ